MTEQFDKLVKKATKVAATKGKNTLKILGNWEKKNDSLTGLVAYYKGNGQAEKIDVAPKPAATKQKTLPTPSTESLPPLAEELLSQVAENFKVEYEECTSLYHKNWIEVQQMEGLTPELQIRECVNWVNAAIYDQATVLKGTYEFVPIHVTQPFDRQATSWDTSAHPVTGEKQKKKITTASKGATMWGLFRLINEDGTKATVVGSVSAWTPEAVAPFYGLEALSVYTGDIEGKPKAGYLNGRINNKPPVWTKIGTTTFDEILPEVIQKIQEAKVARKPEEKIKLESYITTFIIECRLASIRTGVGKTGKGYARVKLAPPELGVVQTDEAIEVSFFKEEMPGLIKWKENSLVYIVADGKTNAQYGNQYTGKLVFPIRALPQPKQNRPAMPAFKPPE